MEMMIVKTVMMKTIMIVMMMMTTMMMMIVMTIMIVMKKWILMTMKTANHLINLTLITLLQGNQQISPYSVSQTS